MSHTQLVAASDAASWVAGAGTVAAVVVALAGLVYQNRDFRRERTHRLRVEAGASFLRRAEQARNVSAQLIGGGTGPVELKIINASNLMITHFEAVAIAEYPRPGTMWKASFYMPGVTIVVPPGPSTSRLNPPAANLSLRHEITFNDDNGARWHKYGAEGLREVPRDFTLLGDLQWQPSQSPQKSPGMP